MPLLHEDGWRRQFTKRLDLRRAPVRRMGMRLPGRGLLIRVLLLTIAALIVLAAGVWAKSTFLAPAVAFTIPMGSGSFYDLKVTTLDGRPAELAIGWR